jgi:hypothetical protein
MTPCDTVRIDPNFGCMVLCDDEKLLFSMNKPFIHLKSNEASFPRDGFASWAALENYNSKYERINVTGLGF